MMKQQYVDQFSPTALTALLASYQGTTLTLLLAEQDREQVPLLQALCNRFSITLDGAIFPQLLGRPGLLSRGAWLLPRPQPYHCALVPLAPRADAEQIAQGIAEAVEAMLATWSAATPPTLFLTFDCMIPNIASALEALYLRLANRVNYAGVNAGSGQFQSIPCLFDNHNQIAGGVTCALLPCDSFPFLEHGYQLSAQPMLATSSENNKVAFIDWQPAFGKYQSLIEQHFQHTLQPEELYQFAVHIPLGLLRANDDVIVQDPGGGNAGGGTALHWRGTGSQHTDPAKSTREYERTCYRTGHSPRPSAKSDTGAPAGGLLLRGKAASLRGAERR